MSSSIPDGSLRVTRFDNDVFRSNLPAWANP